MTSARRTRRSSPSAGGYGAPPSAGQEVRRAPAWQWAASASVIRATAGIALKSAAAASHDKLAPNTSRRMRNRRMAVLSSVGNPACSAPLSNAADSAAHCVASSRRGRPKVLALRLPTAPLTSSNCRAHTLTACRDTPSRCATSACVTLRLCSRAPSTRRASIASRSRFVAMPRPRQMTCRINAQGYEMVVNHLADSQ